MADGQPKPQVIESFCIRDNKEAVMSDSKTIAIVAATTHDSPTSFVASAVDAVVKSINGLGYDCLIYTGTDARLERIFEGILSYRISNTDARLRFGHFSAHGSRRGLHEAPAGHQNGGALLLEAQTCRQFEEAILVLLTCTEMGQFPISLMKLPPHPSRDELIPIRAIVGYRDRLLVPPRDFLDTVASKDVIQMVLNVYAAHTTLLLDGLCADEVVKRIRSMWLQIIQYHSQIDTRLRVVCESNAEAITCWGQGTARL